MTAQQAIRIIKDIPTEGFTQDLKAVIMEASEVAVRALKKEVPSAPVKIVIECFYCPTCGEVVEKYEEFVKGQKTRVLFNNCPSCGQAIDWSKTGLL